MLVAMPAKAHNIGVTAAPVTPVTHLGSGAASLTLWLTVGFVLLGGVVAAFGRSLLEGSFRSRSGSAPGKGGARRTSPDRTFMRSWLALALVGGLLIFAAVSFQLDDTALRSSLLGGVIASAGAATAFYFASKSSDQARQDILNASFPTVTTPSLIGKTRAEVNATLAGTPLYLDALPTTAPDTWTAVSQDPQPDTKTGSRWARGSEPWPERRQGWRMALVVPAGSGQGTGPAAAAGCGEGLVAKRRVLRRPAAG
jgi:hypothetical protein